MNVTLRSLGFSAFRDYGSERVVDFPRSSAAINCGGPSLKPLGLLFLGDPIQKGKGGRYALGYKVEDFPALNWKLGAGHGGVRNLLVNCPALIWRQEGKRVRKSEITNSKVVGAMLYARIRPRS